MVWVSDEGLEDAIYDIQSMRLFAGIDLGVDAVPDATTLLNFRHLLEEHGLTKAISMEVNVLLGERQLLLKEGTIVDATIIAAAPSTKNKAKAKALPEGPLKEAKFALEKVKAQVRALMKHAFHILKNLFGYRKVRYRGLAKNYAQLHTLFALANLVIARNSLLNATKA